MFIDKLKKKSFNMHEDISIKTQTVLAEGMTFKDGNLYGLSGITISGVFFGDVDIEGELIVTESGNIRGNVDAGEVHISGTIEGSIKAKGKAHIYAGSRVIGDVTSSAIVIEENALFRGQCNTGVEQTSNNILNIAGTIINPKGTNQKELHENEKEITHATIGMQHQHIRTPR